MLSPRLYPLPIAAFMQSRLCATFYILPSPPNPNLHPPIWLLCDPPHIGNQYTVSAPTLCNY